MNSFVCFALLVLVEASCAPSERADDVGTTEQILQNEGTERSLEVEEARQADTTQSDKNPVQEWFENLAKNTSSNAQNTMNAIKDWFSQISQNSNTGGSQNLPTMYMGSFQLLKMPMPQFSDVIKGMGNLATAAQAFNKLTGGLPQGLPLVPQG